MMMDRVCLCWAVSFALFGRWCDENESVVVSPVAVAVVAIVAVVCSRMLLIPSIPGLSLHCC